MSGDVRSAHWALEGDDSLKTKGKGRFDVQKHLCCETLREQGSHTYVSLRWLGAGARDSALEHSHQLGVQGP